jgi:predicted ATPase
MNSLYIENYKCFKKQHIKLGPLTVLAGGNSVGKSSVIQALLLSRICVEKVKGTYVNAKFYQDDKAVKIPLNKMFGMALGNTLEVLNRNADNERLLFLYSKADGGTSGVLLNASQEKAVYSLDFVGFQGSTQPLHKYSIGKEAFYYLNAERIGPRLRYEVDDTEYRHVGWNGELTIQVLGQNISAPVQRDRCFDENSLQTLLEQARLWLKCITPGTRLDDAKIYSEIKTAEITLGESRPTNVGFGLSYVLPIIVNGLIALEGSVFIVENPEAHLHPSGQSNIGKFLAKIAASGVQVVLETHSEHVVNGIRLASLDGTIPHEKVQLNFFDRNADDEMRIVSIQLNEKADLTEWPNGFFDQQERDLANIFRLKRQPKS